MPAETETTFIAVSSEEASLYGCPHCGYRSGASRISGGGTTVWECGSPECGKTSLFLAEGLSRSTIGIGGNRYPKLQTHPRHGIPSHGAPDQRPDGGGEFFHSRGIGLDRCTCFVCGSDDRTGKGVYPYLNNIAAFVACKESGERVVAMFQQGARLDYRDFEPDYVQVKVGACDQHKHNLEKLHALVKDDGIITTERIEQALAA